MKLVSAPRQSGKTMWLCDEARKNNGLVIVHSEREAARLRKEYGVDTASLALATEGHSGKCFDGIYLDNLELLIWERIRHAGLAQPLVAATVSGWELASPTVIPTYDWDGV